MIIHYIYLWIKLNYSTLRAKKRVCSSLFSANCIICQLIILQSSSLFRLSHRCRILYLFLCLHLAAQRSDNFPAKKHPHTHVKLLPTTLCSQARLLLKRPAYGVLSLPSLQCTRHARYLNVTSYYYTYSSRDEMLCMCMC